MDAANSVPAEPSNADPLPADAAARRRELAAFLRSRRDRIGPEEAGVPILGGRRRAQGLRREELAALAGVSTTWYTWLEQARPIRVSRQVLGGLARALRLDEVETAHVYRLAGEVPPDAGRLPTAADVPEAYRVLLANLEPLPAVIVNRRFDVLAWNDGLRLLYPVIADTAPDRCNTLRLTFAADTRALYPDWQRHAEQTVALFRAQAADFLALPEFAGLVAELSAASPEFGAMWARMDLEPGTPDRRTFEHPTLGRIELGYVKLRLTDLDATLVIHQPEGPGAEEARKRLAEARM
ncbi:MAG: helix-turn-helix domain-containing protein [Streptomycetaceae bacterium]|nr:helix-turn-helix domain-containing protein [Streptomycetaceae bacterium]